TDEAIDRVMLYVSRNATAAKNKGRIRIAKIRRGGTFDLPLVGGTLIRIRKYATRRAADPKVIKASRPGVKINMSPVVANTRRRIRAISQKCSFSLYDIYWRLPGVSMSQEGST
ncbi:MAG: hypothetical protein ABC550_06710, partial [Candidatus Methanosuratincola petrocarbonis]